MKFLSDFFPVLLFFASYKLYGIFTATGVLIGASILQVSIYWLRNRRCETMHLVVLVLAVVLGGATLWLRDPRFLMWKVTVVNWLFALAFIGRSICQHFVTADSRENRRLPDPFP